jgi:DNA-binding MarR family transcriptional regulator
MPRTDESRDVEKDRILLGLLNSVDRDTSQTHRRLAAELGIALGLVNAYLKRCIRKGLIKVRKTPPRRYAYFLTPRGLSEKSRLTASYLSYSFSLFRQARADCTELFRDSARRGLRRIALAGCSDVAEIATICAFESGVEIVGVVDDKAEQQRFVGSRVAASYDSLGADVDAVLITDLNKPRQTYELAVARFGEDRVLVPSLFGLARIGRTAQT